MGKNFSIFLPLGLALAFSLIFAMLLVLTPKVSVTSESSDLFFDEFSYSTSKGYKTRWNEESWTESDYSLVSSSASILHMKVPKDKILRNKVCTTTLFKGSCLTVEVRFRIDNPQDEPNYAIFLYNDQNLEPGVKLQELDWEFSAALGTQQMTYYYDNNVPHTLPLPSPWNLVSTYSQWTTLKFVLGPSSVSAYLNSVQVIAPFSVVGSKTGGFNATSLLLYLETSQGIAAYGRPTPASEDSELQVDWVNVTGAMVEEGITTNLSPFGTGMDFEGGTDGNTIAGTIQGLQFDTNWIYGDKTTGKYPVDPYGSRRFVCNGNFFALLGPKMGEGRIDFVNGPASYISVLTSTASGVTIDAYDSNGNKIASSGFVSDNTHTGKFTRLTIQHPGIAYVIIHDSGSNWLIDDLVTDAA
jgi:hypothetical protein